MIPECVQFNGRFLMKFLAEELMRARDEAISSAVRGKISDTVDLLYSKYEIVPLTIHEDSIQTCETTGHFTDPYERSLSEGYGKVTECNVTEFRIPFDGDERLFGYTTHPMPYSPYGRVEEHMFIISVKEGDQSHRSDYVYNFNRLKDCVRRVKNSVEVYNSDLKDIITVFAAKQNVSERRSIRIRTCDHS
jgi:hypothetical protein